MAALTPTDLTYWAVSFPSLIVIAAGPDLSYTTGQLIVTNSVGAEYHGIAAGGVVMMTYYSYVLLSTVAKSPRLIADNP